MQPPRQPSRCREVAEATEDVCRIPPGPLLVARGFSVEREAFPRTDVDGREYSSTGTFDGIGKLYFSPSKRTIEIEGLKNISIPFFGQEPDDKYEFHHEATGNMPSRARTTDRFREWSPAGSV